MSPRVSRAALLAAALTAAASCGRADSAPPAGPLPPAVLVPAVTTDQVADDADDPAIWVHPTDPSRSLILGTNKVAAPAGAVVVFGLDGRTRQTIAGLDRPNNIDVEYGVVVGGRTIDVAVVTERLQHRLRVFEIEPAGRLVEHAQVPVLAGEAGERGEPMGVALYTRPSDRALFAIVAPKTGGATNYLAQYRLADDGRGRLAGTVVRRFGNFNDQARDAEGDIGEIEAVVVDDELGHVYYADEFHGIRKWHADPDHPDAGRELAVFGTSGYVADREGLAIYATGPGTGYLVSTDQIEGGSVLKFYAREGASGSADERAPLFEVRTPADATDGLDVTSRPLPGFPDGIAVMMNSGPRNFLVFNWADLRP